jgi:hypothetical protein
MEPPAGIRSLLVLAAASAFLASGFVGSCSRESSRSGSGGGGCAQARVGGRSVCLKPGIACRRRYERVYRSYGLTCRLGPAGYKLRERTYIGPANP